MLEEMFYFPNL